MLALVVEVGGKSLLRIASVRKSESLGVSAGSVMHVVTQWIRPFGLLLINSERDHYHRVQNLFLAFEIFVTVDTFYVVG